MIRLIATDIDGTLIQDSTGDLYPEMEEEIRRLTKQGVIFCAASGRQYYSIRNVFCKVADQIVYVAENGAHIRYRNEDISVVEMRREYAEELIRELRQYKDTCDFVVSTPEGSLVETDRQEFLDLMTYGYQNRFRRVKDVLAVEARILKVAIYRKGSIRSLGESTLIPRWESRLKTCMAGEEWVDFMDLSVDKGNALKDLQEYFQVDRSETMAFGDNGNDIGMLREAGVSYAVENAREEVKAAASHVCPPWQEKGVWQVIRSVRNGKKLEPDVLYVRMLGKFEMRINGEDITPEFDSASKPMQLLALIFLAGEQGIKREEILMKLYENSDGVSAANSLKQLIFRLRRVLEQSPLPKDEYIINRGSRYYWGGKVPVILDTRVLEQRAQLAEEALLEARRKEYMLELCQTYRGAFLPRLTDESWAESEREKYKDIYFEYLQQCCDILGRQKEHQTVLELCEQAVSIYPYDKWQIPMIDSLIALGRFSEAKKLYFKTIKQFGEKRNAVPSEEMRMRFRMMSTRVKDHAGQLKEMYESLEMQHEVCKVLQADVMSLPEIYKTMRKLLQREHQPLSLVLCTMLDGHGNLLLERRRLQNVSEKLERAIQETLREGDCYNRYNESQYLLLLPGAGDKEAKELEKRLDACLEKEHQVKKGTVKYDMIVA